MACQAIYQCHMVRRPFSVHLLISKKPGPSRPIANQTLHQDEFESLKTIHLRFAKATVNLNARIAYLYIRAKVTFFSFRSGARLKARQTSQIKSMRRGFSRPLKVMFFSFPSKQAQRARANAFTRIAGEGSASRKERRAGAACADGCAGSRLCRRYDENAETRKTPWRQASGYRLRSPGRSSTVTAL